MNLFWKKADREEARRKAIAKYALAEMRALAAASYPLAMKLAEHSSHIERQPGQSWPAAYAVKLGLDVPQLRDFAKGIMDTGLYEASNENPSQRDLLNYFYGWAILMLVTEQELASQRG